MSGQTNREKEIFSEALEMSSAEARSAFVRGACGPDHELRERVEALLRAFESAAGFIPTRTDPAEETPTVAAPVRITESEGTVIDRYKLLQKIGEGGMGIVYMAEQEVPVRRRVALKIIKLGMDTRQVVARFEAERQALAMMDHPNIARVLDGGATETGRPYFVMELVQGVPITEFCDKNKLPAKERMRLFVQVCQAIQSAHQKGIIHRDIKPSNVLVTLHHGEPMPKVIDFGIAKATNQKLTEKTLFTNHATMIGTPAYMSPEQAEMTSIDIDTRTDVYSLGVLLYELLTGSTPFPEKRLRSLGYGEMQRVIVDEEPERPSTRLSTMASEQKTVVAKNRSEELAALSKLLRGDLDWVVMRCLEKDRRRRYDTPNELVADIERHLKNEPVVARPPAVVYRFQKMVKRNKLAFAAASAVTLTLIVGLSFSTWSFLRERKAHAGEAAQRRTAVEQRTNAERSKEAEKQQRLRADAEKITAQRHLYVANMNLAQQAWEQNNIGWLRQLLEETRESSDRGFEWYYWQRQTHLALRTLQGHLGIVAAAAFSPDGQRIVTGSGDKTAKVWDAVSGRELHTLKGQRSWIISVPFSPDGQRIVTGSLDQTATIWNAASGKELHRLKGGAPVAFSPDGQRIVTGSYDKTTKVWEVASGRELLTLKGHSDGIFSVAFSPDGERIVTGSKDQTAKVWEAASGRPLLTLTGHTDRIWSVAFSPDGQRIVTGSEDQTAKVWEVVSGRELHTLKGHNAGIRSVAFSPDSQRIVTGSNDRTARVWEAVSSRELLTLKGHSAGINSVAFSPDAQRIVTASEDQTAKVWEAAIGRERVNLTGHSARIESVAFSLDGQWIVTGSGDQTARVWEAANGRELLMLKGHSAMVGSVAFSPDGQRIVTGSDDQTAKVWEAVSGRELVTLKGHSAGIWSVAFSPDGQRIVTSSGDQTARVWETASGGELQTLKGHSAGIRSVAFSPDGQRIVTGSEDRTARVWDAASGKELHTLKGHTAGIWSVAFSPDGQRIITGSDDRTAKVWETANDSEPLTLKGHSAMIGWVAFSPDGKRIVTGSDDNTAIVWDASSGRELLTLKGHSDSIRSVAFFSDGQRIVTSSADQTARVWHAARAEQVSAWQEEERAAEQHLAALQREARAEQEGQRIARARDEGTIKRWLILAPIALTTGQGGAEGLDAEQIEGEGGLRPKAGEMSSIRRGERRWQEVELEDYAIDFNAIVGHHTPWSVAYAVCYIRSEAEQRELRMLVGSDDDAKVYLNGKQIHKNSSVRSFVADFDTVPDITLKAGLNVLMFKVVNETEDWQGSIRFTDAQGNPVKGIDVTLTP